MSNEVTLSKPSSPDHQVDTIARGIVDGFRNINWSEIFSALIDGLSEGLEKDYMRFLGNCGWVPAPDILFSAMEPVVTLVQDNQKQKAERLYRLWCLRNYNKERLYELLDEWKTNPLLSTRFHILCDAVEAHIDGKYTLSIPVLMAQIEGFMWSVDGGTERVKQGKLKALLTSPAFGVYKKSMERLVSTLYAEFKRDNLEIQSLNRNAVLHGIDTSYATITNSLQLVLIMQILAFLFDRKLPQEVTVINEDTPSHGTQRA